MQRARLHWCHISIKDGLVPLKFRLQDDCIRQECFGIRTTKPSLIWWTKQDGLRGLFLLCLWPKNRIYRSFLEMVFVFKTKTKEIALRQRKNRNFLFWILKNKNVINQSVWSWSIPMKTSTFGNFTLMEIVFFKNIHPIRWRRPFEEENSFETRRNDHYSFSLRTKQSNPTRWDCVGEEENKIQ